MNPRPGGALDRARRELAATNGQPGQTAGDWPGDQAGDSWEPRAEQKQETAAPPKPLIVDFPDFEDSATFFARECRPAWLVKRVLASAQPCVMGGPQKSLKTSILIDLALSMASGTPALGYFDVPRALRVGVLSGESGEAALKSIAWRVAKPRALHPPDLPIAWGLRLPSLANPTHVAGLAERVEARGLEVLLVDPLYLALLAGVHGAEFDARNLFDIGPLLMRFAEAILAVGCTPLLAHHFKQTRIAEFAEPDLGDLTYAGCREYARQWILLSRRSKYEHDGRHALHLVSGGSIGHSYSFAVDVNEGIMDEDFGGRVWEPTITGATEARRQDKDRKSAGKASTRVEQMAADELAVMGSIDLLLAKKLSCVRKCIQANSGLSRDRTDAAIERLLVQCLIRRVPVVVTIGNGGERDQMGFTRTETEHG